MNPMHHISFSKALYDRLPVPLQNLACGFMGYGSRRSRYGGRFKELLEWLEGSQWWDAQQIEEYQESELLRLIEHAYSTVPYYSEMFRSLKLRPGDIKRRDDLQKLPILTKEQVRLNEKALLSSAYRSTRMIKGHTSGSTGKSLHLHFLPGAIQFRWAVWWRHKRRFGIEFDAPYATFTGQVVVPINQLKPPYWRKDWPMRQTIFTMHHIVPEKVKSICERLNRGGFEYYAGYPSILSWLAVLLEEQGLQITSPPKVIFTGAENLYDDQRQLISKTFKCTVTDQYGFSEGCGNASRCPQDVYHEDFEYGILEADSREQISPHQVRGRIIATGFANYAMPLVRYDVGDVGVWSSSVCSCGRHSKVLSRVEGRVEDYVLTPEGSRIMRFDYIFKDTDNIKEAQVLQKKLGEICIRLVRRPAFSTRDENILRDEIKNRISPTFRVEFEYVNEIEREPNGKLRAVKSLLQR